MSGAEGFLMNKWNGTAENDILFCRNLNSNSDPVQALLMGDRTGADIQNYDSTNLSESKVCAKVYLWALECYWD